MAPKVAMMAAPTHVSMVPTREKRVKGSLSTNVAKAVLKTRPAFTDNRLALSENRKSEEEFKTHSLEGR